VIFTEKGEFSRKPSASPPRSWRAASASRFQRTASSGAVLSEVGPQSPLSREILDLCCRSIARPISTPATNAAARFWRSRRGHTLGIHCEDDQGIWPDVALPAGRIGHQHTTLFGGMGYQLRHRSVFMLGTGTGAVRSSPTTSLRCIDQYQAVAHEVRPWRSSIKPIWGSDRCLRAQRDPQPGPVGAGGRDVGGFLEDAGARLRNPRPEHEGPLLFGVDLAPRPIVVTAMTSGACRSTGIACPARRSATGLIVNFGDAVPASGNSKACGDKSAGAEILSAATAFPPACRPPKPGVSLRAGERGNHLPRPGRQVSAAQALLKIRDGAIVDVGGGSTGVGIVSEGKSLP